MNNTRSLSILLACLSIVALARAPLPATEFSERVVELVNAERAKASVAPLAVNSQLTESARRYAGYLGEAGFFSHVGPDGSTLVTRNIAAGYRDPTWLGENIAAGYWSPESVVAAWMESLAHRSNILDPNFAEIGVATVFVPCSPYGRYWVQEFGRRNGVRTAKTERSARAPRLARGGQASPVPDRRPIVSAGGALGQLSRQAPGVSDEKFPKIASITPSRATQGQAMTVIGRGFGRSGVLRFGGLTARVDSWTDTKIVGWVPEGAISAGVTVTNNSGEISIGVGFQVISTGGR